ALPRTNHRRRRGFAIETRMPGQQEPLRQHHALALVHRVLDDELEALVPVCTALRQAGHPTGHSQRPPLQRPSHGLCREIGSPPAGLSCTSQRAGHQESQGPGAPGGG
ncbi:hypothetical protein RZS08_00850, partial [Arthrospira platensis SPKY1]|nr:hypothetical protein [Arthrospira platensis SPKY1]